MIASTKILTSVLLLAVVMTMLGTGCDGRPSRTDTVSAEGTESDLVIAVVTKAEFEKEVLKADVPVLVDFYATWCPPCTVLSPRLAKLSTEFKGRAKFVKVDIDKSKELATEYQITSYPTVIVFNKGKAASPIGAVRDADTYRKVLDAAIEANR